MIISKELVCEVLDIDERLCRLDKLIDNTLFFYTLNNTGEYQHYINIYEFAHKCKEWAWLEGNELVSFKVNRIGEWFCTIQILDIHVKRIVFQGKTEPEAIFKACQWLFENKRIAK